MMRSLLMTAALIGVLETIAEPASAQFYGPGPWCAVTDKGSGIMDWNCQFSSFQKCQSSLRAGGRGFCNQNPSFGSKERKDRGPYRN